MGSGGIVHIQMGHNPFAPLATRGMPGAGAAPMWTHKLCVFYVRELGIIDHDHQTPYTPPVAQNGINH